MTVVGERFRVEGNIGHGLRKLVYLAHDELLDRPVAIAVVRPDGFDEREQAGQTRRIILPRAIHDCLKMLVERRQDELFLRAKAVVEGGGDHAAFARDLRDRHVAVAALLDQAAGCIQDARASL